MKKSLPKIMWLFITSTIIVGMILSGCASATPTEPAAIEDESVEDESMEDEGPVELVFVQWSHALETVLSNVENFEALNPEITVTVNDASWRAYHDVMAIRLSSDTQTDVTYSSDHWLQEWIAAGWIVPLLDNCPDIAEYADEFAPFTLEGATVDGKVYGIPYYADLIAFFYNSEQLAEAGFVSPPQTWDELETQALALKEAGVVEYPVGIALKKDDPFTMEFFYSMVYSRGGHMFDEDKNPVFNEPGSAAEESIQWLHDAVNVTEIINPASMELVQTDLIKLMGAGTSTFMVSSKYNLADLNSGNHDVSGQINLGLMPGESHETNAFSRYYILTEQATTKGQKHLDAACKLIEYLGGKTDGEYVVAKRWALEHGLGFGTLPLYQDPEVIEAINSWGDVQVELEQAKSAHIKEGLTPWWGAWDIYAREQIQAAVGGEITPAEALQNMSDSWESMKEDFQF